MIINIGRFGEMEIREEEIIHFPNGIPGFERSIRFVLVHVEEHAPFSYLQSVDEAGLSFIVIDPFDFFPSYEFNLNETIAAEMRIEAPDQVVVRTIINLNEDISQATTNLVAPVVMNKKSQIGRQVILTGTDYTTRHKLFE
ncbi:flagellar assembly protein FliW [Cohnella xylanilytica]|uniref:flagellar assembly protein FliW n=1 Tax=Cohnella xylanilytica TaxID=557555 RepID=UPI001B15EC59|nr:flagellar assembly protein FliW [Cohnella xylanilytica]GIO12281.1 flagellar assembly protein FliW [Cohnella xylanilytica]